MKILPPILSQACHLIRNSFTFALLEDIDNLARIFCLNGGLSLHQKRYSDASLSDYITDSSLKIRHHISVPFTLLERPDFSWRSYPSL
jgi:hypothetical protein